MSGTCAYGITTRRGLPVAGVLFALAACAPMPSPSPEGPAGDGNVAAFTKRVTIGAPPRAAVVSYFPAVEYEQGTCYENGPCVSWTGSTPGFEVVYLDQEKRFKPPRFNAPELSEEDTLALGRDLRAAIRLACPSVSADDLAGIDTAHWSEDGNYLFTDLSCPGVAEVQK